MSVTSKWHPRVVVTGATGFLGQKLVHQLIQNGFVVTALVRNPAKANSLATMGAQVQVGDFSPEKLAPEVSMALEGAWAVIHLAGESIARWPWSQANKQKILNSRVLVTQKLSHAISQCKAPPQLYLTASGMGYHGDAGQGAVSESDPPGQDFLGQMAKAWEEAAHQAKGPQRIAHFRFGMILGRKGGAFPLLAFPFRFGLGAVLGSGKQGQPWIHIDDVVGLILYALTSEKADVLAGPVHAIAPQNTSAFEFARTLAASLKRPLFFRVPGSLLRLALGEMADLFLHGQFSCGDKVLKSGYVFRYPTLSAALKEILA